MCSDLRDIEEDPEKRQHLLEWHEEKGYLTPINIENAWDSSINQYKLNWDILQERLGVDPPTPLVPLSPEEMKV